MEGTVFSLARWFDIPEDASGAGDDFIREQILGDLYENAETVGVLDGKTFVQTANGAAIIERNDVEGILVFDYVENFRWKRTTFWMNASSVRDLGDRLRALPRRPFDELFVGAVEKKAS